MKILSKVGNGLLVAGGWILFVIAFLVVVIGGGILLTILQSVILVPEEYIMWGVFGALPVLILIIPTIFSLCFYYYLGVKIAGTENTLVEKIPRWVKSHKTSAMAIGLSLFILVGYFFFFNIYIISSEQIVSHSFFRPLGKEYAYSDIKAIHTGTYSRTIPFVRSKGEFYYILELNDGRKVNLFNISGIIEPRYEDPYITIMELDQVFVDRGIDKNVEDKYVYLFLKNLDKIYADMINHILENTN